MQVHAGACKYISLILFKGFCMNIKKRCLSVILSGLMVAGVCIPSGAQAKVSPWKVSKVALYSLLGTGCGLSAIVKTVKKSTGMDTENKIDNLNIALLTIISCYSFVWAYEHYQDIVR